MITIVAAMIFSAASGQESFRYPVNLPVSFGVRQYNYLYNSTRHTGADYLGQFGNPILAAASGEIVYKENMSSGDHGMGYNMIIRHIMRDGSIRHSFYGHMNTLATLNVGDMVYKGQQIGTMGNSGYGCSNYWNCSGCSCNSYDWAHLHFELKSGTLNPASATANSCNPYNGNNYWGYTPNHPDNYCYEDPTLYVAANSAKFTSTPVPGAPNNISNVSTPVNFFWSPVPNAVYRLQVYKITNASPGWSAKDGFSTSNSCSSQLVVNVNIQSGNSFTWNALLSGQVCALPQPNKEYSWTVRSYINGAGTSPYSFPVGFITGSSNSLTVSPTSRSVSAASGNTTFSVTSVGITSTVTDNASWLTVSPTGLSGSGTLTATYSANTSTSSRTATITITGGGITRTATVVQAGATASSPANDNPCGAISLPVVSSWTYTTGTNIGATTTTNPGPTTSCNFYGYDVWYSFIASASTMTSQMAQTGTATDMMMALYSGSCGSLSGLTCDDDSGPGSMPKIVRSGLTVGVRYYIRVWGYNGQTGTFGIAVRSGSNLTGEDFPGSSSIVKPSLNKVTDDFEERMNVYPNPTFGRITIATSSEGGQVRIVNLFGQTQKTTLMNGLRVELDLTDLPSGVYFVHYAKGERTETARFELIH